MIKNIVLIGNNTAAVNILNYLKENNENIVAVIVEKNDQGKNTWQLSLKKAAEELKLKVLQPENPNNEEFLKTLSELNPDLLISIQCRTILKKQLLTLPKYNSINLHFAPLPKYRGCYPIAWALLNGETEFGVSLHYIDEGVDTGDLINQTLFPIDIKDNGKTLFNKASEKATELFINNYSDIKQLKNKRIPQEDNKSSYYSINSLNFKKNKINFNQSSNRIQNFIRAFHFPPHQYAITTYQDQIIEILDSEIPDYKDEDNLNPGTIIEMSHEGILVKTNPGVILLKNIKINNKDIRPGQYMDYNLISNEVLK